MNTIEIINKIKEVALSQATVNTVYDGDVYENWNSAEAKYASVNIGIQSVSNEGSLTTYSIVLYYGDRLLQDKNNVNSIYSDGVNTLQSIVNILNTVDMVDIQEPINYTLFQQQFSDYLAGVYCQIELITDSTVGYCSLDNYVYVDDKDKLIERLIEEINHYKTEDERLASLLQEILYKLTGEISVVNEHEYVPEYITKRYLIRSSSQHYDYQNISNDNQYTLSLNESFINENEQKYTVNGEEYYIWKRYEQTDDGTTDGDWIASGDYEGEVYLLTKSLEPTLPLIVGQQDTYILLSDGLKGDEWEGISDYHTEQHDEIIAYATETNLGNKTYKMANIKARLYSMDDEISFYEGQGCVGRLNDYYQYNGDTMEWNGETCYVWYRYDSGMSVRDYVFGNAGSRYTEEEFLEDYGDNSKAILTNTLWINQFPFTEDSPEYVATINFKDEVYDGNAEHLTGNIDRIEYLPEKVGEDITLTKTLIETKHINLNVFTRLCDNYSGDFDDVLDTEYVYRGETVQWNNKTCYVWDKNGDELWENAPYKILTNTLDIKETGWNENSPEYEVAFDYNDEVAEYHGMQLGSLASNVYNRIVRTDEQVGEPIYKDVDIYLYK